MAFPSSRAACGFSLMLALGALALPPASAAEDKKGAEQLRRMQQKMHVLEQEKAQLMQGKTEADLQLKSESDKLGQIRRTVDAGNRQRAALERDLHAADSSRTALAEQVAELEKKFTDTSTQLTQTSATLEQVREAKRQVDASLVARTQSLAESVSKNDSLHRLGIALLGKFEEKGSFVSAVQPEFLTRLKAVGTENMIEEYRDKLDADLVNQQLADRQAVARKKALLVAQESDQLTRERIERDEQEKEMHAQRKARQQSQMDKLAKRVRDVFGNIEW